MDIKRFDRVVLKSCLDRLPERKRAVFDQVTKSQTKGYC